jgi:hypothetical protein
MFHQETNGITASAATKTLVDFLGRGNGKRRGFFVMKGAKPQVIGPSFPEFDKLTDYFVDINPG